MRRWAPLVATVSVPNEVSLQPPRSDGAVQESGFGRESMQREEVGNTTGGEDSIIIFVK